MLTAAFLPDGPVRDGFQGVVGLLGTLALFKFFVQIVRPNEGAYRVRNGQKVLSHGHLRFSRDGVAYFKMKPHYRTYRKGWYFKCPFIYDLQVTVVGHETRDLKPFNVDCDDGHQYTVTPSITYRIRPLASWMFRAQEMSVTLDSTVLALVRPALMKVLMGCSPAELDLDTITQRVQELVSKKLQRYGVQVIEVSAPLSRSLADMLSDTSVKFIPEDQLQDEPELTLRSA